MNSDRRRWTSTLATVLLALFISMLVVSAWIALHDPIDPIGASDLVWAVSFTAFPLVGWLIAARRSENPLGWIYLTFPIAIAIGILGQEIAVPFARAGYDAVAFIFLQIGGWLFVFGFWLLLVPGLLLFPDGRLPNDRFRWALLGSALLLVALGLIALIGTETSCIEQSAVQDDVCNLSVDNPLKLARTPDLSAVAETLLFVLLPIMGAISLIGFAVRYRRSSDEVRQQIKWVAWVGSAGILVLIASTVVEDVLGVATNEWVGVISFMVITVGLPVAIGVAIFKYRLYDIDRIISRTAAYAVIVTVLAAVYVASVTLMQRLLPVQSQLGIVASTLVVAALFNPLRWRVQDAVDRRFNRSRFDAKRVLDEFSSRLRDDVTLEQMQVALLRTAQETMQPSHLSLWVRERGRERK